ncbi:MAG: ATP-binding cassette domain-containing protein, partial [Malacoplasma sp.]|nr:ATP-binding cassette domain-containing protein [Malacoplasma sp.]
MKTKTDNKKLIDENLKQQNLLDVSNLSVLFKMQGTYFKAVNNISFKVNKGDFFGIVGESGSGKSTTGKSIVRLNIPSGGKISFDGKIISTKKIKKTNKKFLQNNIQMIFQDPMASLNYSKNVLQLISEPLVINKTIRKKSLLLKKNFDLIYRYYWSEFLEEYTNLYRKFMLDYWNDLVKAYKSSLESNGTIDFNSR